ncbi:hypothetical protein JDV02_000486 [Purpureocillium takamizusanense]|uniref:Uncharacterized protein n=1 Tax=Purpureocillium takamizusanense TaxID=2060973 RepID=A0A9Q8V6X1_9HYPO|nr:uncharacterized protein JDV02_000486 [Purpureocillium takamizusanense]UNI13776.1 hypothetical protein JDV02_000486 [Purpureocillium takamizusanense]
MDLIGPPIEVDLDADPSDIATSFVLRAPEWFDGVYHVMVNTQFQTLDREVKNRIMAELIRRAQRTHVPCKYPQHLTNDTAHISAEDWARDCQALEADARAALLADGCPPRYPPNLPVPLPKNLPCDYYDIIAFWRSHMKTTDHVLAAQYADWRIFFYEQKRYCRPIGSTAQNRLKMWDDFHAYYDRKYKAIVRRRDEEKAKAGVSYYFQARSGNTPQQQMVMYSKFFTWIEQQREKMEAAARLEAASLTSNTRR